MPTFLLQNMPIPRKVTAVILLTCVTALSIAGVALFAVQVITFQRSFVGDLSAVTAIIASNCSLPVTHGDRREAFEIMRALEAKPAVTYAAIRLNNSSIFVRYGITPTFEESEQTSKVKGVEFVGDELVIMRPIFHEGRQIGMLQVRAAYRRELYRLTFLYGEILVGVLTVAVLFAFLFSARLRRSISDPILELAETARIVAEKNDYSVRAQKLEHKNELGTFTDSFNKMLAQIETQDLALQASRDELERKVVDRTLQLSSSNRNLERELEDRQRAEETARQARIEAERANHAKSEFLSRMSHELRTPLNSILGFGQLLEIDFEAREVEGLACKRDFNQERESVDQILKGGAYLLELINEVLDLSTIEAGRMSVSCEPVALDEVLQESIELIQPLARSRQIELVNACSNYGLGFVSADRQRLKQVMLNLLSNAIKYNRGGGRVTVSCGQIAGATESGPDRMIQVQIADTGLGISAENLHRIFQPFQRLGAEETEIEGTGLGLALSKRMVTLMGGTLTVESEVGQGSIFSVDLTAAQPPRIEEETSPCDFWRGDEGKCLRTVLFVEDNLSNLRLVQHILSQLSPMKIVPAMQGGLAIELSREHRPDVIFLDLDLPDIPGHQVLTRLRSEPTTRDIPVVIMSADATDGQRERLLAAGAFAYLSKPLDVKEFIETIDRALNTNETALA